MLSVLIPAYNSEDVVGDAIQSALEQALDRDMEVVIVDDGSADATADQLRAWQARVPDRVRIGFHESNRGGAAARNTAASLAGGRLLYMLDADNVLTPGCIASQLTRLEETGLDAVAVGEVRYFEGATANVTHSWAQRHDDGRSTVRHLFETTKVAPSHGNYLFSRRLFDAVGGYSEDAGAMDTWTFGLKHLARDFEIGIDAASHYLHRLNRPGRASYWTREERSGTNDVNAIRALRREAEHLPGDLRELVAELAPDDPFFSMVTAGAFRADVAHLCTMRRRERVRRTMLGTTNSLLSAAARMRDHARRR